MTIYSIVDYLTGLFDSVIIFMIFDNYMERRKVLPSYIYILGICLLTVGINISNNIFGFGILNVACILFAIILASFLYKGSIKTQIILSVLVFAISVASEVVVLLLIVVIRHIDQVTAVTNPNMRLLGIMLSKTLWFAIAKFMCMFGKKRLSELRTGYWILFTSIFFITILTIYLIFTLQQDIENTQVGYLSIVCSIGLLYSIFITLYLYERMSRQAMQLRQKELSEQQFEAQVRHMDELILAQSQVKSIKHDLSNHMLSLKSLLKEGNYTEGNMYLDKLIDEADIQSDMIDTGNIVIDAIITAKRNLARKNGIDFQTEIQIPEQLKIDSSDCCVIFGNALDNAIEACNKVKGNKYIKFSLVYYEESLICKITNSMRNAKNYSLKTTKTDSENHGIGFINIKNTLGKYKHMIRTEQNDGEFLLSFILFEIN